MKIDHVIINYKDDLEEFFQNEDVKKALNLKKFDDLFTLYSLKYDKIFPLTALFLSSHISFLSYLEQINRKMFQNLDMVTLVIPDNIKVIGDQAFSFCNKLESISLPNSLYTLNNNVFEFCTKLKRITFRGTTQDWRNIYKYSEWDWYSEIEEVICTKDNDIIKIKK